MTDEKTTFSYASDNAPESDAARGAHMAPAEGEPVGKHAAPSFDAADAPAEAVEPWAEAPAPMTPAAPEEAPEAAAAADPFAGAQHFAEPEASDTAAAADEPAAENIPFAPFAPAAPEAQAPAPASAEPSGDAFAHAAPKSDADILGDQDTGELPPLDALEAAAAAAELLSPDNTAEIDIAKMESRLTDPGSTQSFEPITEERIVTDSTYDAGTTTSLMWGARSDVGCVRPHNEDSYLVASPLFAVCDGMGGHAAGEVASSIAVETIAKLAPSSPDAAQLAAAVEAANAAIIEAAAQGVGRPGMGCTATVAYIEGNTIAIAHVGDSRAYLMHDGVLTRITRDHSYVEELVDAGEITADEARIHPNRSVITRALGSDPAMYADHFQLNIEEGDRLILCSDGLSSMIPDSEIENIAVKSSTAQMCTDNLVDAALAAGGADNVSVVVVDVVNDGRLEEVIRTHRRNVFIAIGALVAAVVIGFIAVFLSIANSVFLGVDGDTVGLYRGINADVLGIELNRLEEETSIKLSDLPEDTQNRLREGISQESLDQAWDTLSDYRRQIDEEKTKKEEDAETIRESAEAEKQAQTSAEKEKKDEEKQPADKQEAPASDSSAAPANQQPQPQVGGA